MDPLRRSLPRLANRAHQPGNHSAERRSEHDKAGSKLNLLRWVSTRTIKETYDAAESFEYPFMDAE